MNIELTAAFLKEIKFCKKYYSKEPLLRGVQLGMKMWTIKILRKITIFNSKLSTQGRKNTNLRTKCREGEEVFIFSSKFT